MIGIYFLMLKNFCCFFEIYFPFLTFLVWTNSFIYSIFVCLSKIYFPETLPQVIALWSMILRSSFKYQKLFPSFYLWGLQIINHIGAVFYFLSYVNDFQSWKRKNGKIWNKCTSDALKMLQFCVLFGISFKIFNDNF